MSDPIRVLLVEDQFFARLALHTVIDARSDMRIVAETGNGAEVLTLFRQHHPDVTIMDLRLPGMSGFDAIRELRRADSGARIVVLSNYEGTDDVRRALQMGALGYLTKATDAESLIQAILCVYQRQCYLPLDLASLLGEYPDVDPLTAREREIVALLAEGLSNREIGARLGIAEKTVRVHMTHILDKMGADDRTQLLILAVQRGMIHLD